MRMILRDLLKRSRNDDEYCYLFLHIAKCAGTSLVSPLERLGRKGIPLSDRLDTKLEILQALEERMEKQNVDGEEIKAIYGHSVFRDISKIIPRQTRFALFLREPASMVVSLYNYFATIGEDPSHIHYHRDRKRMYDRHGNLIPFYEWLDNLAPRHVILNFLYHAAAGDKRPGYQNERLNSEHLNICKQLIDQAYFVGLVDHLKEDGTKFLEDVGLRRKSVPRVNVSRKYFTLSDDPSARERIEHRNCLDYELYRYALARRHRNRRMRA